MTATVQDLQPISLTYIMNIHRKHHHGCQYRTLGEPHDYGLAPCTREKRDHVSLTCRNFCMAMQKHEDE